MASPKYAADVTRNTILGLLSDAENAKVSNAEGILKLSENEDYIDLENLDRGVQRETSGRSASPHHVLPRNAVKPETWAKIVEQLGK